MSDGRFPRALRLARRVAVAVLLAALVGVAAFLPFAGRYLHADDSLERADAIFVLAGTRAERWLEGFDLYRAGWAPRIVLSSGRREPAEDRLQAMGIRFPSETEPVRDALTLLKVPTGAISVLPQPVDNTAQEAAAIRIICEHEGWTRLIVVTSVYHSRRVRLAFRREFQRTPVKIVVRTTRYDPAVPGRWWSRRYDTRYVVLELQKLALYWLGVRG